MIFICWGVMFGFVLILMLSYSGIIWYNSREELLDNAELVVRHYGSRLDKDVTGMAEAVNSIYVNNFHYKRVRAGSLDDYDWIGAAYYINGSIQEKVDSLDYPGGMFFYDADRDSMRSVYSNYNYSGTKLERDLKLRKALPCVSGVRKDYAFMECSGESWLVYFFSTQNKYLGFTINLNRYFGEEEKANISYVYQEDQIVTRIGDGQTAAEDILQAVAVDTSKIGHSGEILTPVRLNSMDMTLVVSIASLKLYEIWEQPDFWVVVILIPVIFLIILLVLLKKVKGVLLYPVEHISHRINEMVSEEGNTEPPKLPQRLQIEEFRKINRQIDEVLERMVCLQEEKFRERQRVKEVQLQYYQLQVNPHFFLNCLNTVCSLLEAHSTDAANDMIRSFSSYFRYVFRDQRQPVTVEEEMKEVRAYCNIYSIKGGFPILLQSDIKEEAKDCRIPILCIQTFVENSIKHAMKEGMILTVKVKAGIVTDEEGKRRVSISIADNGCGYPEELIEELNRPVVDFRFRPYHVGIDNLKYRICLAYQGQGNWYFCNSPYGGSTTEIILPEVRDEHTDY
jgi:Putative regulator of cell autolysis